MFDEFYYLAMEVHKERILKENDPVEKTFRDFKFYCFENQLKITIKNFEKFYKEKNICFWIAKKINEKFFGYVYSYKHLLKKWEIKQIGDVDYYEKSYSKTR